MAEVTDKIAVRCNCGAKLRVPAKAIGKRIKCPKCEKPLAIKAPAPKKPAPIPVANDDDLLGAFDSFESNAESSAPVVRAPVAAAAAPAAVAAPPQQSAGANIGKAALGAAGAAAKSMSGFGVGVLCSAIGATIGGAIWFAIAWFTDYEVGYIAILVGFLSGLGMAIGNSEHGGLSSLVAVAFAMLSIIGAKYVMYAMIFLPAFEFMEIADGEGGLGNMIATVIVTEEMLRAENLDSETVDEEKYDEVFEQARLKVESMTPEEIQTKIDSDPEAAEASQGLSEIGAMPDTSFAKVMLGPFDALWCLLAALGALKVSGGIGDD